ncbi:DUF6504 family protein [Nonomuraea sp. NPDC050394]|uniref:DUF6504 family protein n=1 Tax=Nonomuraea sp. NPDC050394 TaxID=3364363 RepID=UPI0037B898E6
MKGEHFDPADLAHLVNQTIDVQTQDDDDVSFPLGRPTRFHWPARNRTYEIIGWERDPWCESRPWWTENDLPPDAPGDDWYYKVRAKSAHIDRDGVLVIKLDTARRTWTLIGFED